MVKPKERKWKDLLWLGMVLVLVVVINMIAARFPVRIDLTEDKRYTISEATKEMLQNLEDVVYVEVYLEGDFPAGFQRLQTSVQEKLEEFRIYAGSNIQYRFIDPATVRSGDTRNELYQSLAEKGIQPTNLFDTEDGKRTEKLIFPGAVVSYGSREEAVMLLKGNRSASSEERLNQSVEGVEFELASAIRQVTAGEKSKIALLEGHGELDSLQVAGLTGALMEVYDVFKVNVAGNNSLSEYAAVIVAKPEKAFSEADKYKLDQYLMAGGNILFFIDALHVDPDSIGNTGTFAFPYNLQLEDQLFNYGVRINPNLIQDLTSGSQPVVVGNMGDQPQVRLLPWPFYPLINNFGNHPTVKNLDAVSTQYVSSIDTVKAEGIAKIPLLYTSQYSRLLAAPVQVDINDLRSDLNPEAFNQGSFPIAYLLEGEFSSLYKNRILPETADQNTFKPNGRPAKVLVVADGDVVSNKINPRTGQPFPLGFDPYAQYTFSNQQFVMNMLQYMLDERGIITARAKEIMVRPLDDVQVQDEKIYWQLLNLLIPVVLIVIFGIIRFFIRKRKFTRF